jgi:hypothetical protein
VEGDVLEDVWDQLNEDEQVSVITELVAALARLHSVRLSDKQTTELLDQILREDDDGNMSSFQTPVVFGGPHTRFLSDGPSFLQSIMTRRKLKKPFCTIECVGDSQDMSIKSSFEELGSITINKSDIEQWPGEAVFCHNDPTPRNIIVQRLASSDGTKKSKLAGIIDWKLAGFYPASYELSLQDAYLGANRHASFYLLWKEHMKELVPRKSSQIVLLQSIELIFESQQRLLANGTNVPAHIRKRFLEYEKLTRDQDPYVGWARRKEDGPFPVYSRDFL